MPTSRSGVGKVVDIRSELEIRREELGSLRQEEPVGLADSDLGHSRHVSDL